METIADLFTQIVELPIYRHGWLLFSMLAIVPAIVSGNLVQHYLSALLARKDETTQVIKLLLLNVLILLVCISVMVYGFLLH